MVHGLTLELLKRIELASTETTIELVNVTPADLGFDPEINLFTEPGIFNPHGTFFSFRDIYSRAAEVGLDLVPAEAGPQLSIQYGHQAEPAEVVMGMEPIWYPETLADLDSLVTNAQLPEEEVLSKLYLRCNMRFDGFPDAVRNMRLRDFSSASGGTPIVLACFCLYVSSVKLGRGRGFLGTEYVKRPLPGAFKCPAHWVFTRRRRN